MTNHWIDLKNSDCILIMGSNAAENHPISFKYVTEAQKRGAKMINVDPRFTRTSSKADLYVALRSGTDIAFLGGMIKYILDNTLYNKDYVVGYTDAAFLVGDGFEFKDGLFSGYDPAKRAYDKGKWALQRDDKGVPKMDRTLQDKRCVFQLLKQHYSRYTPKLVSTITGTPEADLLAVYKAYAATGATGKAGTIMYAMGWTQHTVGVQNIRTMSIIQLLLANMGVAGGGVNALRGESNVQGSTDHALLYHLLPVVPGLAGHELAEARRLPEAPGQERRPSERQLVAERAQVHGQPAQGLFRRQGRHRTTSSATSGSRSAMPASPTAGSTSSRSCTTAGSRASSPGARTRPAAAPIPTRRARPWPSSTGWSTSTSSTTRPAPSGTAPA